MRTAAWTDSVSVLDRLTAVLDAFSLPNGLGIGDGLGVTELARRANLPKSTASRIASELVSEGYLDRVAGKLYLGLRFFDLGQSVEHPRRLRRAAMRAMVSLRDITGHNIQLAIADGEDMLVIANAVGRTSLAPAQIGSRLPREGTAFGAAVDSAISDALAGSTSALPLLHAHHETHECFAVPVLERSDIVAALSVSVPPGAAHVAELLPRLQGASVAATQQLRTAPTHA